MEFCIPTGFAYPSDKIPTLQPLANIYVSFFFKSLQQYLIVNKENKIGNFQKNTDYYTATATEIEPQHNLFFVFIFPPYSLKVDLPQ